MSDRPAVFVEFFGIPRQRAGLAKLEVNAGNVRELVGAIAEQCPRLSDLLDADGQVGSQYLLSIDGQRFVSNADEAVPPGSRVLLLSADVGG